MTHKRNCSLVQIQNQMQLYWSRNGSKYQGRTFGGSEFTAAQCTLDSDAQWQQVDLKEYLLTLFDCPVLSANSKWEERANYMYPAKGLTIVSPHEG